MENPEAWPGHSIALYTPPRPDNSQHALDSFMPTLFTHEASPLPIFPPLYSQPATCPQNNLPVDPSALYPGIAMIGSNEVPAGSSGFTPDFETPHPSGSSGYEDFLELTAPRTVASESKDPLKSIPFAAPWTGSMARGEFDLSTSPAMDSGPSNSTPGTVPFRVETKTFFVCTEHNCNKRFSRLPDLHRHHRGTHQDLRPFRCRALGCERAERGFPRRDKRDVHERKTHVRMGGLLL
jgi:hypothetical protein